MRGDQRCQVPALTGIRACAALGVFLAHISVAFVGTPVAGASTRVGNAGATGVTLFFVLSGYLLAAPSTLTKGPRDYALRRFARIYPAYLCTLLAMFVVIALADRIGAQAQWSLSFASIMLNVLLLQAWHLDGMSASIVYPAWSLSVECFFYLLLALILPPMRTVVARAPRRAFSLLAVLLAASALLAETGATNTVFPPIHLATFLIGSCLSIWQPPTSRTMLFTTTGACVGLTVGGVSVHAGRLLPFLVVLPYALLVHCLSTLDIRTPLMTPVAVFLGKCSYSFFLIHSIVISMVTTLLPPESAPMAARLLIALTCLICSWLAAAAMYLVIEIPAQNWLLRVVKQPVARSAPEPRLVEDVTDTDCTDASRRFFDHTHPIDLNAAAQRDETST